MCKLPTRTTKKMKKNHHIEEKGKIEEMFLSCPLEVEGLVIPIGLKFKPFYCHILGGNPGQYGARVAQLQEKIIVESV